jgi:molybdate transport system ATP-binding protein
MNWEINLQLAHSAAFRLDVDLNLPATGCTVIFGPSGSGKTTLLRSVAGLAPKARGRVVLGKRVFQDDDLGIRLAPHQRHLGVVFQTGALFPHLSVLGNLEYARQRKTGSQDSFDQLSELLDLTGLLHRSTDELSGGERQRVAFARALLTDPDALLLDEPLASIDGRARKKVLPYLEQLQRAFPRPILYVTHNLEEAARLGDHLVILADGKVQATGPLVSVLTDSTSGLATGSEACSVLEARVASGPDKDGLARLTFAGSDLWIPATDTSAAGKNVRVLIRARDVSLVLEPSTGTSILNVVPVVVDDLWDDGPARVIVRMKREKGILLAAVTRRSAMELDISPGRKIFAQIKSMALL